MSDSYVYLLVATNGATYVGATVDVDRRLRQHNREIKGGACATGAKVARGETWTRHCYVRGFPDWQAALQFEWRWKQISRRLTGSPVDRRFEALQLLLGLDRPTSAAVPYAEYITPLEVVMETQAYSL
jgi:structure-specific endonuclease subunit SLX1